MSALDLPTAVDRVAAFVAGRAQTYVCVTGVHGVMESQRDEELLGIHNASGMTTPDGMPMVWAGRWAGHRQMQRVYGPDLMLAVCERGLAHGWRHYLYGGGEGVAEALEGRLTERFPGLRVVGTHTPPFRPLTPAEDDAVVDELNALRPDVVWVGLSTPKQERWMAGHAGRVDVPVLIGVGAAFDMHAGLLPQAPRWVQLIGMEWAYRLAREPRRLWRRYLRNNPAFLAAVVRRPPRLVDPA